MSIAGRLSVAGVTAHTVGLSSLPCRQHSPFPAFHSQTSAGVPRGPVGDQQEVPHHDVLQQGARKHKDQAGIGRMVVEGEGRGPPRQGGRDTVQ